MPYPHFTPVGRYVDFSPSTFIIPKMYWDAFSLEQRYHALCKTLSKLITYADMLGLNVNELGALYEALVDDFEAFKEHGFDDYYAEQLEQWVNENMSDIIAKYVSMVFFGLTLDGHFVAYIPTGAAWDDIMFDTGMVYGIDTYGRLILRWDVDDSAERVNQRPEDWS